MTVLRPRVYMAGAGGMLGEAFYKHFMQKHLLKCTDKDVNENWLSHLDFRDYEAYRKDVMEFKPDWLFHIGAHTDLEYCELNPEDTYATNTKSVEHAVKIANELKLPILYISTAGIFNGKKNSYDENDVPDPMGHYAKSKYMGEQCVQENANDFLICRAGWMMGGGERKDKKFIQKLIRQIKQGRKTLHIVNDKLGTPTYTKDFALNTSLLIDKNQRGLFNMACKGVTSRLDVARELIDILKMNERVKVEEVGSDYFSREYFAKRPPCERLVNKRLNDLGLNVMRDWKIALHEYVWEYYADTCEVPSVHQ